MSGLFIITPEPLEDERGFFMELYHRDKFATGGIDATIVQANNSWSKKGVVRGLHFQWDEPLGKLMRVPTGAAFLVAVDIRKNSPTFGKWFGEEFSPKNNKIIWAPPGFAMGFCALEEGTTLNYMFTALYNPRGEGSILWNDSDIGIKWPVAEPIVSERDKSAMTLKEWLARPESDLFKL